MSFDFLHHGALRFTAGERSWPRTLCGIVAGLAIFVALSVPATALAAVHDTAIEVSASVQESPPSITLSWVPNYSSPQVFIFRKGVADADWSGPLAIVPNTVTTWTDEDVAVGCSYEYSLRMTFDTDGREVVVPVGTQLTFTIRDSWGDGMCCVAGAGSYRVSGGGGAYASGGEFGDSETTTFTAENGSALLDTVTVSIVLDAFPIETSWSLTETATGTALAQGGSYDFARFGHILAGIRAPEQEDRGTVLLLVDESVAAPLAAELRRLQVDLVADGYRVRPRVVSDDAWPPEVKEIILAECAADPSIETLFLFGSIAVPYSGDLYLDHADHVGAWPADVYYGDLDGAWTDSTVYNVSARRPENHNVPGDGKFDQSYLPSDVELQVGRVDLSRLPSFPQSETELLRRYLNKNHAFRTGQLSVPERAIIHDQIGVYYHTATACFGWRNFTAFFGPSGVEDGTFMPTLQNEGYLWSLGLAGSNYTHCGSIVATQDFAQKTFLSIFMVLFGSYFVDWDNPDNVLRAPLAATGGPLTCFWPGHPGWAIHHMALGYPIGYSTRLNQNNYLTYTITIGGRGVHQALMGDPTLRMHIVRPPGSVRREAESGGGIRLSWPASPDTVLGYHVYRASGIGSVFTRLDAGGVADTTFLDADPSPDMQAYMVRAIKLETTGSGTYLNLSPGAIDSVSVSGVVAPPVARTLLTCGPNPFHTRWEASVALTREGPVTLQVHDPAGRLVRTLAQGRFLAGRNTFSWDATDAIGRPVPCGLYFLRLVTPDGAYTRRIVHVE